MRTSRRRAVRIALGIAAGVVALLGLAQLLLPGLAAQRVRDQLGRYGSVRSASVSAFPAIELLWGHAQSATVSAGNLSMSPAQASELLWKARGVQRVDMRAASMRVGTLTLRDVSWHKRGQELTTRGSVAEADLLAAIPGSTGFQLLGSTSGGVEMRVSGSLFGVAGSVEVLLSAQEGKVVAQPQGIPFAGLVKITLLSAPHMYVQSFGLTGSTSASAAAGDPSYLVSISARLR